jgi:hypothetical protein
MSVGEMLNIGYDVHVLPDEKVIPIPIAHAETLYWRHFVDLRGDLQYNVMHAENN